MKSPGPSIPRGKLHTLLTETRSLQAIQGVYSFFRGRMRLVNKLCKQEGVEIPPQLTFENMAKEFMKLAAERYPSSARVLQTASKLGIDHSIPAQIIALNRMREAVPQVAGKIFGKIEQRDELFLAIITALEDLEDALEELSEKAPSNTGRTDTGYDEEPGKEDVG